MEGVLLINQAAEVWTKFVEAFDWETRDDGIREWLCCAVRVMDEDGCYCVDESMQSE